MAVFPPPTKTFPDVCAVPYADLIEAYKGSIALLREACAAEIEAHKPLEAHIDPNFGDDLYLLRFVLSHHKKGFEKCRGFFLKALEWRAKNAHMLGALRLDIAPAPHDERIRSCLAASLHYCTNDGHPIYHVRAALAHPNALFKRVAFSRARGLPYIPEEDALAAAGLQPPPLTRPDGGYGGSGYVCTLSPNYRGDGASSLATLLGAEKAAAAAAAAAAASSTFADSSAATEDGATAEGVCGEGDATEAEAEAINAVLDAVEEATAVAAADSS